MQRLFWTFADGWPGIGLLVQRVSTGGTLLYCAFIISAKASHPADIAPALTGAAAGILLILGLWTPLAGVLIASVETWIFFTNHTRPALSITLAILGATLSMIGPGAWSVDARLFGRKHIETT